MGPTSIRRLAARVGASVALAVIAGCPTIDLGEPGVEPGVCRPNPAYFETDLWPMYLAIESAPGVPDLVKTCVGRAGCHAESDGRSALRLDTTEPIDFDRNYRATIRFLNCGSPETSSLFTRPLAGEDAHGGGDLFVSASTEADVFRGWF